MNVFDIIVESDFKVVRGTDGFNIVGPNGNVVGTERIAGNARAKAAELNNSPLTVKNGKLNYKLPDGTELSEKHPRNLAKQLDEKMPGKLGNWLGKAKRVAAVFAKVGIIKISLGAQGAAILYEYFEDVEAFKAIWAATYPRGHTLALGSPYYQEAADATLKPLQYSAFAAAATVMSLEVSRLIKAGKVRRIVSALHKASAVLVVGGPVAWAFKAIIFALTEGAIWAAGWTVQRYGPTVFHYILNSTLEDVLDDLKDMAIAPPPADPIDVEEIKNAIRQELESQRNGDIPTPPQSDIKTDLRNRNIDLDQIEIPD